MKKIILNRLYYNRSELDFSDETIKNLNFSYDEKTAENYSIATLPKSAQLPNCQRCRAQIMIAQIEDFNEDCINISCPYYTFR